jgi:hypothetical protein
MEETKILGIAASVLGTLKNFTGTKLASSASTGRQGESSQISQPRITAP